MHSHPIHSEVKRQQRKSDRIILHVVDVIGSLGFTLFMVCFIAFWLTWNSLDFVNHFDSSPGFFRLSLLCNLIQLITLPILLISQNVRGRKSDIQIKLDYDQNIRMEQEVKQLRLELEQVHRLLEHRERG